MRPDAKNVPTTWFLAQRALACSKPRCRTLEQIDEITDLLVQQAVFKGVERADLLAIAYFIEAKHAEAGECVLSKGQPLEQWCLLLDGNVLVTRYSSQRGSEQSTSTLGPNDSWGEAAVLHSSHPRRSSITVVTGQQGCISLRLRYTDFDAINDPRTPLQLLPPEGTQGPLAVPEITLPQRRAASLALLCCCLRRLVGARPPDQRTPEEASELEPFLAALPAYRTYPSELISALASACRSSKLAAGSLVYEHGTLADAQVTVLCGEVQLRRFGGQPGGAPAEDAEGEAVAAGGAPGGATAAGSVAPSPPPGTPGQKPGTPAQEATDASGGRLSIRARLRREREARKIMQRQLDEYVSRMDAAEHLGGGAASSTAPSSAASSSQGSAGRDGSGPVDWTRVFMQKAMRTTEPVWKALHPADNQRRRRQAAGDGGFDNPLDEGPITEVAQLLGPAAAKAYYRGLQSQGYSDTESPNSHPTRPHEAGESGSGAGSGGEGTVRERWRRWVFTVEGPETEQERNLRSMAMKASRIIRDKHARSLGSHGSRYDVDEMDEMYGPQVATLTRGSPVGELSTVTLHGSMRKESAVAGPGGCEVLLVDWETYQQGVLAARSGLLARSAAFLGGLPKARLTQLAELCLCLSVDTGTLLARQGGALESLVVVQQGELQLMHEPSAALHTRIATVKGHAVSRSRNGRTHTLPLLATLSQTHAPGPSPTPSTTSGTATPVPPSPAGPPAPALSGPSSGSSPAEVTIHGLPLGEISVGGILGEGIMGSVVATPGANGHNLDPAHPSHVPGKAHLPATGAAAAAAADGHHYQSADPHLPQPQHPAPPAEGPKWPATVLAARASVLLVLPKSVLYMAEFDGMRGELVRYAAERKAWLAKRVEAAYREAAAPPSTPAVFANGATAPAAPPPGGGAIQQPLPSLRRSVLSGSAAAAAAGGARVSIDGGAASTFGDSGPRRAASGDISGALSDAPSSAAAEAAAAPSSHTQFPISRRRSVDHSQRSASPAGPAAAATSAAMIINGPRPASKWDFLDGPTTTGTASIPTTEPSVSMFGAPAPSTSSYTRVPVLPLSPLDSGGSFSGAHGSTPLRGASAGALRASKESAPGSMNAVAAAGGHLDMSGLTPMQQALLEVGLDPNLASEGSSYGGGGEAGAARRNTAVASLPALTASTAPFIPPRVTTSQKGAAAAAAGGGSPAGSADFDAQRSPGGTTPFRSPNALTPSTRRSCGGNPPSLPGVLTSASLMDQATGGGGGGGGAPASPSSVPNSGVPLPAMQLPGSHKRASYCGTSGLMMRRTDLDGVTTPSSPRGAPLTQGTQSLPLGARVPALQALDGMDVPSSPGLHTRNARGSLTGGGITPRISSMENLWQPAGGRASVFGGSRGGGGSGVFGAGRSGQRDSAENVVAGEAEAEEEASLARSLVPKNQAGMFMVREGLSSTPTKQPAVRRIAGCF